ncbi:ATP-dependent RNA helicase HrpA [Xanthomonas hortorum]|uniref:ATP-dependent RNA helicase HrpA n=3 Tax=Xanthomonas hortorum TaxID=56454 RepID=A0A6V7CH25_9XANT|nr:ATP-dependent RNA helicase HrpA [Xanthomonas hortorum]MCE4353918.1 ATP-dependent RNA helicase HrpA [Xanthomonas hortorum pv. pelargonii]MCM5524531.1 ATP-dependent RNA helicase HrpA [Xanthomonas hortorum pv. pelargonii]MCM5535732.1 ATP-dependent RNA helicase HrpA [Xanthomonas hortorum pv. pelargonii]MCM5540578.1 ATP-dependent RNA helicase HrpA [Xanthomonas hortorum pv. pelargonii]MCM5543682.1 ATP-dependent RNA helicase HrpA [Xanthomonas hortorum pv. pelargonii]
MSAIDTDLATTLRERRSAVDGGMSRDRGRLLGLWSRWQGKPGNVQLRQAFEQALAASQAQRQARAEQQPAITLDTQLPIAREAERIIALIRDHQVVVIAGETGSGKTTQLPKLCLAAGRGAAGMIGCTQPRRIAARAVAARVAEELKTPLGTTVGFQVRFTDRVGEDSRIKFMTDGILLAEIASDRWLSAYDTIIVDEAHERSLNIDFLLGYLKQLLVKRSDLKLIVTSATIDTERFSQHFDNAPVINVEGRTFPVEVRYRPLEGDAGTDGDGEQGSGRDGERTVNDAIVAAIDEITRIDPRGDVLMFLPGEREIRDAHQSLERRKYRETEVVPLYARLSAQDQDRVFNPGPRRRLVLATNVAETSLTVPRSRYVVDPGFARIKRYSPRQKLDRLHIEPISQASANQRMGRCGRIAEGICYRLYAEADFAARPAFTDPEIRRASLSGVILRMLQLGLGRIEDFPFLEAPDERAVADGWQQLLELGAIDGERRLTATGRQMARLPVDVKLARMLVAAQQHGCLREMIVIASFLGIQDPRERPPEAREAADNAHALFADARSEFVGILRLWEAYRQVHEELTQSKLRDWCNRHFLGFLRMREWRELHRQLRLLCEELGWSEEPAGVMMAPLLAGASAPPREDGHNANRPTRGQLHRAARLTREGKPEPSAAPARTTSAATNKQAEAAEVSARTSERERAAAYQALHRALLAGLPTQIGHRTEKGDFLAARQRRFVPFPGSALARKPPPWILAATLLDTQKVWGMTNAAIEPDWAIAELPHLLARKHFDPHWSRAQGQVVASEQISLFGLVLAPKKPVHFGKIDPAAAHDLFVRQGLVTGEINTRAAFVADNLKVLEQAREEEAKLRRAGIVADEEWQARWYLDRIPSELHSASGLDAWWKTLPPDKRRSLHWSLNDLLPGEGSEADRFPKYFPLGDARLPLHYRFEPGAIDDGVTLDVPLHLLNALDPTRLSWLAPGFVADKASALIRSLPKAQRRNYVPAPDFGRAFYEAYSIASADDIRGELARFLSKATGTQVAALDFDEEALDTHLLMNLRLRDDDGKVLAESRDLDGLRARFGERAGQAFAARAGRALAAEGLRDFPATPIPEQVSGEAGVPAYPALVDQGEDAALRIFADRNEAAQAHPRGVRRLLEIALADKIKQARKQLPVSPKTGFLYAAIESQERLRGDLVDAALNAVLAEGLGAIRDAGAFAQRRDDAIKRLFGEAMERLTLAESILGAVAELKPLLEAPLMGWARGNLDDMEQQLRALVHAGFLRETPAEALANYPRYLKAMILRTERAKRDPARDQTRMLELKPFVDALGDAAARGLQQRPEWESLRWDLEELRVSVFAQELGAKSGVSAKKLSQRVAALRA